MPRPDNDEQAKAGEAATGEPDYKALWEEARADADKWKERSRKNEGRAKSNAGAAADLEEANRQLADLGERLAAIEGENAALKSQAERSKLVSKVAQATGVPEAIVSTLAASDEKGLSDAATAIAEAYRTPGGAPRAPEAGVFPRAGEQDKSAAEQFGDIVERMLG